MAHSRCLVSTGWINERRNESLLISIWSFLWSLARDKAPLRGHFWPAAFRDTFRPSPSEFTSLNGAGDLLPLPFPPPLLLPVSAPINFFPFVRCFRFLKFCFSAMGELASPNLKMKWPSYNSYNQCSDLVPRYLTPRRNSRHWIAWGIRVCGLDSWNNAYWNYTREMAAKFNKDLIKLSLAYSDTITTREKAFGLRLLAKAKKNTSCFRFYSIFLGIFTLLFFEIHFRIILRLFKNCGCLI